MATGRIYTCRLMILAVLFVLTMAPVDGQTADDIARKDSLQEVVITGRRPTYNMSSPTPVQSLKGRDLERVNSLTVADALRYFSGMQVKDYGGIGGLKTVNIRSMGTNHVGVFYDGIQLGNAQNGQTDLGRFSLDNMEAVDLYNAQKSDIFQSAKDYGSAGTIYLTTIKPSFGDDEKTKLKLQYRTALFEGTKTPLMYGLTNPSVIWQQKLSNKVSSTVSAEWTHSGGEYRFEDKVYQNDGQVAYDTAEIRKNSDINAFRLEGGLNGDIKNGEWSAKVYYYNSERGLPGATVRDVSWRDQRQWDNNFFAQGWFRKSFGERYHFKVNGKYAYDYTHFVGQDVTIQKYDNKYIQQEAYLSAINMYQVLPVWKITLSADFQYNKLDAYSKDKSFDNFSFPQRYTGLAALATALDFGWLKAQASMLGTLVREQVKMNTASPAKNVLTPAFFVSYKPFKQEEFRIRAFYKRIFRMPTFNDLYYTLIGNKLLKPEYTTQYDAGLTWERLFKNSFLYRISAQTDAYYNTVTNKIVASPGGNQFSWTMFNLDKVEIRGVDVATDATCRAGKIYITARLAYTFQKAQDATNPSDNYYRDQIPFIPTHSGSAIIGGIYGPWSLNYSFIYTGERYDSQANIPENHLQPWYTSDMSLTREFKSKATKFKLTAEINNMFNQYYAVVLNYPMPGRNYRLAFSIEI